MGFISAIQDIYKKGTDSFGLHSDKLDDEQLNFLDRVIHYENDSVKFNSKLLLHIKEGKNSEVKYFLDSQEDACYIVDSSGATLLHYAAQYLNATMTENFINSGFNIDALDDYINTPLLLAVSAGIAIEDEMELSSNEKLKNTIAILLDEGANIHMVNKNGDSALSIVFRYTASRHSSIVNMFLSKVREESSNNNQVIARKLFAANCPLALALRLGGSELTRNMLELGSLVDSCDQITGQTALHVAIGLADLKTVKLLLDHKANVNAVDYDKRTPWMNTGDEETSEMIEILMTLIKLPPNLDIELMNKFLSHGQRNTVLAVMQSGCDLFTRNEYGETPIHFLARNPNPSIISEVLEGKQFDVNVRDRHGNTPLMDAAIAGHTHAVEFLLSHKADANMADCCGLTPLHSIFFSNSKFKDNHVEIVELLLQYAAKIQCDNCENTIFDLPSSDNYQRLITIVLAHLAKIEAQGKSVDKAILDKIVSHERLKQTYVSYQQELEEMKMYMVHGSVTLFELLIESEEELELYASDEEFICNFNSVVDNEYLNSYYLDVIKKRVAKAIIKLEMENACTSMCSIV